MTYKVPLAARIGFGVGDLSFLLVWQGTSLFLLYFYTDVLGIPATIAGSIYLAAMVWDAISDPVIATLADRTRSKMGKYRPWLLFGALPFAISYPLAFSTPPAFLPIGVIAWALITHLLLRTTYTVVSMPFNSLQARLTNNSEERTVLASFRMVGAAIGAMLVAFLTPVIVSAYGETEEAKAYFVAACLVGSIAFATLLYCFFSMREPEDEILTTPPDFLSDLKSMGATFMKNPPLIRMIAIIVIASATIGMFGQGIIYHFKYHLKAPDLAVYGLVLSALPLIFAVPFWAWFAGKTSKRLSFSVGVFIALIGFLLFFSNFSNSLVISLIAIGLVGLGAAAIGVMYWAMLPDTVEYGEAMTGVRAEAKTFGFATFAQKAAVGINAVLFGLLLDLAGFIPNTDQTDSTLIGLRAIIALIPAIGVVAILIILRGYHLDKQMHAELVAKISEK